MSGSHRHNAKWNARHKYYSIYKKFYLHNQSRIIKVRMVDTFEGVLTWMGHVLYLDPDGNNTGVCICRNSPNNTLKLVFFAVYKIDIH